MKEIFLTTLNLFIISTFYTCTLGCSKMMGLKWKNLSAKMGDSGLGFKNLLHGFIAQSLPNVLIHLFELYSVIA